MVKRLMIRGHNDKVFIAEMIGKTSRIISLEMHTDKPGKVVKNEIYQISNS